jgi:hypothetical protein
MTGSLSGLFAAVQEMARQAMDRLGASNRRCINSQRSAGGELVPPIGFETPGFETPKLQERRSRKNVAVAIMQAGMPADEAPMVGATVSITQI